MTVSSRAYYLAAVYTAELLDLGQKGFEDWLKASFLGVVPAPTGAHFYTEDLDTEAFGDIFARIVGDLSDEARSIAEEGVTSILRANILQFQSYEGLFSIIRMGESLRLYEDIDDVGECLDKKLGHYYSDRVIPSSINEVFFLRETLECLFRISLNRADYLRRVTAWAYDFFNSELPRDRYLKPVLAPIYVLARIELDRRTLTMVARRATAADFEAKLFSSHFSEGDPFSEFFEFESQDGRYPFDLDGLLNQVSIWLEPAIITPLNLSRRFTARLGYENLPTASRGGSWSKSPDGQGKTRETIIEGLLKARHLGMAYGN